MDSSGGSCGPLCQHPSCWREHRRLSRSIPTTPHSRQGGSRSYRSAPGTRPQSARSDDDEEGLPRQSVMNLLDDFGEDQHDKYPSKTGGRPLHEREQSKAYNKTRRTTRESLPRLKAPAATPSSLLLASAPQNPLPPPPKPLTQVEVQEVFDLEDLQSQWQDTFMPRKIYVWVPGSNSTQQQPQDKNRVRPNELVKAPGNIPTRDLTEEMCPREIASQRLETKRRWRSRSPNTPQQGQPSVQTPYMCKTPGREYYYGIYELLDLPKEVLLKVLKHIDRRDLLDRDRLVQALTEAFPKLESESSALSMAYGDVLQQQKISLHDSSSRMGNRSNLEPIPAKQFILTDLDSSEGTLRNSKPLPPAPAPTRDTTDIQPPKSTETQTQEPRLLQKKALPSIKSNKDDSSGGVLKVAAIGLSLPELPSGVRVTKPFSYSNNTLDLALHRVKPPRTHQTQPTTKKKVAGSPTSSEHSSTLHVTMPTVATVGRGDAAAANSAKTRDLTATTFIGFYGESTWDAQDIPMHAVSPTHSTGVPMPPNVTPAVRPQTHSLTDESPSPVKNLYPSPVGHRGLGGLNGSPENTGLGTIQENDQETSDEAPQQTELPRSRRSVRFAKNTSPVQPPSTPEPPDSPGRVGAPAGDSLVNHVSTAPGSMDPISRSTTKMTRTEDPSMSPEPWPQVDEEMYDGITSPSPDHFMHQSEPLTTDNISRESTFSKKSAAFRENLGESPGPPPPSPEPKDLPERLLTQNSMDSDSEREIRLSAKPPSNLDDISRIQTPATPHRGNVHNHSAPGVTFLTTGNGFQVLAVTPESEQSSGLGDEPGNIEVEQIGQDSTGQQSAGQDSTGQQSEDSTRKDNTEQDKGQDGTRQEIEKQEQLGQTEQDSTGQENEKPKPTEQENAELENKKQDSTEQNADAEEEAKMETGQRDLAETGAVGAETGVIPVGAQQEEEPSMNTESPIPHQNNSNSNKPDDEDDDPNIQISNQDMEPVNDEQGNKELTQTETSQDSPQPDNVTEQPTPEVLLNDTENQTLSNEQDTDVELLNDTETQTLSNEQDTDVELLNDTETQTLSNEPFDKDTDTDVEQVVPKDETDQPKDADEELPYPSDKDRTISDLSPQKPAYPIHDTTVDALISLQIDTTLTEAEKRSLELDHFESTEEDMKEELKDELVKLDG